MAVGRLAQPEERFPYKEEDGGSSPSAPTNAGSQVLTFVVGDTSELAKTCGGSPLYFV